MKKTGLIICTALAVFVLVGASRNAEALSIRLDDLGTAGIDVEVSDEALGDVYAGAGAVAYMGSVGSFNTNVTSAVSSPIIGSPYKPRLDLVDLSVSSSSGGTLEVWATEKNFNNVNDIANMLFAVGGTTDGEVKFDLYSDSGNVEFGTSTYLGTLGTFTGMAYSDELMAAFPGASDGLFSLTIRATITHAGSGISSFDAVTAPVPEPTTMFLLGSGLFGLAATKRKKEEEV